MVGVTLAGLRERIDDLATDTGEYYVACGRTGDRPIPITDKRFRDRTTARRAAAAAEQYRAALRRYDPQVPRYDFIVRQASGRSATAPGHTCPDPPDARWVLSEPVLADAAEEGRRDQLIERCHRVAAATFEALSDCGYREVERAVMDRYAAVAESLSTSDGLCLCLLESMAETLSDRLNGAEQATVLARAADRLQPRASDESPVTAAFTGLQDCGVVGEFSPTTAHSARQPSRRVAGVHFSGYVLSPRRGRLPVLPIVVDLFGRLPERPPRQVWIESDDGGWRLGVAFVCDTDPGELVNAPIRSRA
jgi:hypothetical protein